MKLLVTGASGLLGLNLALEACKDHEVVGVDRDSLASPPFQVVKADLLDTKSLIQMMDIVRPEAVIHCAAIADIDLCEINPKLANQVNAELPGTIAQVCAQRGIRLAHISTDAVFDGRKFGAYLETDPTNPQSVYAKTKYDGEEAVLLEYPDAVVARVNFYGWSLSGKRSLAEFFVNNLKSGKKVNGFIDITFCPMQVNQLAEILIIMLEHGLHGRYHVVGPQAMTKFQFGVEIARKFGQNEALVSPQSVNHSNLMAQRSHNLWLSTHKISTELKRSLPAFSTGLDRFYTQYEEGYPQKIRSYQQSGDRP